MQIEIKSLLHTFPLDSSEYAAVGLFFWTTVCFSWVLSFTGLLLRGGGGKRNYSIVDRLWPLFPALLAIQWSVLTASATKEIGGKTLFLQSLVLIWSLRLTYNSVRRGDYALGAEDYRWTYVRGKFSNAIAWEAFNFLFIAVFQISLLYLMAKPIRHITMHEPEDGRWTAAELVLAAAMVAALAIEAVADQQQYRFQLGKRQSPNEPAHRVGFVHTGLWRYSRHPNLFCEQAFWLCVALFCAQATGADLGVWRVAGEYLGGFALLALLMQSSVALTEAISSAKYPLYKAYQVKTSMLVPWAPWSNARVISQAHRSRA
ncbi:hypothetical protein GGI23_002459 [Coemansia sp. RSA 2559]|nr:hypothetical protein GGI23_002459 [Coemansia sp. RSA 2559]KAJ2862360.1 hypothetical protein GGI22_002212 [Coemansia erecta]